MSTVTTRSSNSVAMEHVLQRVLQQPADSHLEKALKLGGFDLIEDVLTMSNDDINQLVYSDKDASGSEVSLTTSSSS